MGLQYKLCYKKGSDNTAADALSRVQPHSQLEVLAVSVAQPVWLEILTQTYTKFPVTKQLLTALAVQNPMGDYTLSEGVIKYKGRVLVPPDTDMQHQLIQALHSSAIGGHSGYQVTYQKVKQLFYWAKMKQMIQQVVAQCQVCQQAKTERVKYPGLLQPLPVPSFAWQIVSLDFIEGLPCSHRYSCILVVVDKFSKFAHFIPLMHPFTAFKVAATYMDCVQITWYA